MHVTPADAPRLRTWITDTLLHELHALPGVAAAHLWTLAPGEPPSPTSRLHASPAIDHPLAWVIVAETTEIAGAAAIRAAILGRNPTAHGAAEVRADPVYRLLYALDRH